MATKFLSQRGLDTLVARILAELSEYVATSEYDENVEALNETLLKMVGDIEDKADSEHTHNSLVVKDQNGNVITQIDTNGINTVSLSIDGKPITKIFVGTQAEYDAADANGEIEVGTMVIITDDTEESGGGSSSGGGSGSTGGVIPTVETIEDPTSSSPTFVMYDGQLYALVDEEEE